MDPTVPRGAAMLLDLIGSIEAPKGYETVYGNNQGKLPKPLTSMTVGQVIAAGSAWTKRFGSSACGRYQFMKATLQQLVKDGECASSDTFNGNLQDRLGLALLRRRGYDKFASGKLSVEAFGLGLAQEWASFPVLKARQGAHRRVKRGETYYAGDKLNKSLVSPETVEACLALVQRANRAPVQAPAVGFMSPEPAAAPEQPPKALLMTYQQRLKDLGFYGLKVDGKWGDGTSGGIAAFKHANGLTGEATFDPEMVALLMSDEAQAKTVSEERANATAADIRAESPIVRKAERGETAAVVQAAVPAAGGLAWYGSQAVEYLKPVREFLEDVPVGVWVGGVVALAVYLWWQSRKIKEARVAMHRNAEVA